jgi:integrase
MTVKAGPMNDAERSWPFDLSRYNRRKSLSKKEQRGLAVATCAGKLCIVSNRHLLDRLIVPLEDALAYIAGDNAIHFQGVISVMLREVQARQLSFWGWSREIWREVLDTDHQKFAAKTGYRNIRCVLLALAYLFNCLDDVHTYGLVWHRKLARHVFGHDHVESLVARVQAEIARIGYAAAINEKRIPNLLCKLLLANHSPRLEDLTSDLLEELQSGWGNLSNKEDVLALSRALHNFGIIDRPLRQRRSRRPADQATTGVPALWAEWITRWRDTSPLEPLTRRGRFYCLCKVGRWIAASHPELADPTLWRNEHAVEFIAALKHAKIGEWSVRNQALGKRLGKPLSPATQAHHLSSVSTFFQDCQEWSWIPTCFNPQRAFQIPRTIKSKVGTNPRVIADDIWAKLLWAGLNFTDDDVPKSPCRGRPTYTTSRYPVEMIRAMALTWLFCGLRANEIARLRVGCIRWQREDVTVEGSTALLRQDAICWLDVPVTKTSRAFTKPVDVMAGKAIEEWERVRPDQRPALDPKTGEIVHYLFFYREQQVSNGYLNRTLIPMLCRKAGVPLSDTRGMITSHRARSTIASQLYNSREPMSLFDLQEWLGHSSPNATQYYAKVSPTKLAKKYEQAGYFERNVRTIEVLIDREAIVSGAAAKGEPWQYYDLGHGWCTHAYFVECPHRMACPKCSFYVAKDSTKGQFIEGQSNLMRMLQKIPLTEDERAAVEEGIDLFEKLCQKLADVPTPDGFTPLELGVVARRELPVLSAFDAAKRSQESNVSR